jgi:phosphate transport system substrate-binding protein
MFRRNITSLIALGILLYVMTFISFASAGTVRVNGSGAALDMMKPLIAAYEKANPGITIEMEKPMGSSGAVKALIADALDIAVSSKPLKQEETAKGLSLKEYGKTPLVIITEKSVKKSGISTKDLEDIYSGKTINWPGGKNIRIVLRPREDIDTLILQSLSAGMNKAVTAAMAKPGMIVATTDPEAYEIITKTPGAIGLAGLTTLLVYKQPVNTLTLNIIKPSIKTLADGTYPLAKNINFILKEKISAETVRFLDFIYSAEGRRIASATGVLVTAK